MIILMVILAVLFFLWIVLFHFGTRVRRTQAGIYFGFRKYTNEDIKQYTFKLEEIMIKPRRHIRKKWFIKVEVWDHNRKLRTHMFHFNNEVEVEQMIVKINDLLKENN